MPSRSFPWQPWPPYGEGPSDVRQFIDHYLLHAERPGMRLVIAREGEEVIGFTYGHHLPANTGWWGNVDRPLPADFTHEDGTRTWVILDWPSASPGVGRESRPPSIPRCSTAWTWSG
ncbi:hypothetical protein [Streptomyces goshikiensis]